MNGAIATAQVGIEPGLHLGVPMEQYLSVDALGSSQLEWLAVSPLHYRHMKSQPREETSALAIGSALHMAVLEPDLFEEQYCLEPDVEAIGGAKPRATKAYKEMVSTLLDSGQRVLTRDAMAKVLGMRDSIFSHPHAAALLRKCPEREVTALWSRDGRLCRARFDMLGKGIAGNIKTTRKLKDFSPWTITRMGYYRAAGWYADGARRLDRAIANHFFLAVENVAPYDVGVFVLDEATLRIGMDECELLLRRLAKCEADGRWPGMYPDIQEAQLNDSIALQLSGGDSEED